MRHLSVLAKRDHVRPRIFAPEARVQRADLRTPVLRGAKEHSTRRRGLAIVQHHPRAVDERHAITRSGAERCDAIAGNVLEIRCDGENSGDRSVENQRIENRDVSPNGRRIDLSGDREDLSRRMPRRQESSRVGLRRFPGAGRSREGCERLRRAALRVEKEASGDIRIGTDGREKQVVEGPRGRSRRNAIPDDVFDQMPLGGKNRPEAVLEPFPNR